jgi:phospholipase/lecithinase/hemolysin
MRQTNFALALLTAAILSACGGGDNDTAPAASAKPKFLAQVNFGDSLSDVGTYKVGAIAQLGGGKYTINGDLSATNPALTGKVWPELVAAQLALPVSCPAQTGLEGTGAGFNVPVVNYPTCNNYAQGGSRVTEPAGPGNKLYSPTIGQLTRPITEQIDRHLAKIGGKFNGSEVIFVMAGGNDALQLLTNLNAAATAAGGKVYASSLIGALAAGTTNPAVAAGVITTAFGTEIATSGNVTIATTKAIGAAAQQGFTQVVDPKVNGPIVLKAQADAAAAGAAYGQTNGPAQVTAMSLAGAQEAELIRSKLVANGAKYVVVNNLPDIGSSPTGKALPASSLTLVNGMVSAFNTALRAGIDGLDANVLYVDLQTISIDQVVNPAKYGITNATAPACGTNPLGGTSLVCNGTNIVAGDVSHYLFADGVHPTPFGSSLIYKATTDAMVARGWL